MMSIHIYILNLKNIFHLIILYLYYMIIYIRYELMYLEINYFFIFFLIFQEMLYQNISCVIISTIYRNVSVHKYQKNVK